MQTIHKHSELEEQIVRGGSRIRESVRSLPKGHFQQYRRMFEKQTPSTDLPSSTSSASAKNKLSTIHERSTNRPSTTEIVLRLPKSSDENRHHFTVPRENDENRRNHFNESEAYLVKSTDQLQTHQILLPSKRNESLLRTSLSIPEDTEPSREMKYSTNSSQTTQKSPTINMHERLLMKDAINYSDSYQTSTPSHLKRTGSSRNYAASIQQPVGNVPSRNSYRTSLNQAAPSAFHEIDEIHPYSLRTSKRAQSSTSLSSTGYDSNSSPSMKSTRDSSVTNISHDFIANSVSSSSASSSSDEQQHKEKPWSRRETNLLRADHSYTNSNSQSPFFNENVEPTTVVSRQQIQLSQNNQRDRHSESYSRHAIIVNSSLIPTSSSTLNASASRLSYQATAGQTKPVSSSYVLQTTSFPQPKQDNVDMRLSQWNKGFVDRTNSYDASNSYQKLHEASSSASIGFQLVQAPPEHMRNSTFIPIKELVREESPLPIAENPLFQPMAPKKPPRTFEQENRYDLLSKAIDQEVPSSCSSQISSPTNDLGSRSISCMNLTTGASTTFMSNTLSTKVNPSPEIPLRPGAFFDRQGTSTPSESIYETLRTPPSTVKGDMRQRVNFSSPIKPNEPINGRIRRPLVTDHPVQTPTMKRKGSQVSNLLKPSMKKGISEPNLTKNNRSKSPASVFFSPRQLFDRFKRILPLSGSRQSLHEKEVSTNENVSVATTVDTDDSLSTSSENSDQFQTSKLRHVKRVKSIYDTMDSNRITNLIADQDQLTATRELKSFYDYVVHLIPENEIGYFSNGNGCLATSRWNPPNFRQTNSIRFKYPTNAKDETNLKYFCFPNCQEPGEQRASTTHKTVHEFFRFVLTNLHGSRQYGYCSRFVQKGQLNALCLVSPYDAIDLYERVLSTATELILSYKEREAQIFLMEIYQRSLPSPGETIDISTTTVGLYTLKCEQDRRKSLIDSMTFLGLSTETIIKIFSSILYEQKLIFISESLGPLTRLINTFICLLYPFSWPHTFIPVLPAVMLDVIQAPTPYIIGILRSCESYLYKNDDLLSQDNSDIMIIDIDQDSIRPLSSLLSQDTARGSTENLSSHGNHQQSSLSQHILPKTFKIELKQEISALRKNRSSLSLDECQQRLRSVFMSIFVQSCYNYREYLDDDFDRDMFLQSKQHTIALFLEWFTQTQIFHVFLRQKVDSSMKSSAFAITFDRACDEFTRNLPKQAQQVRITARAVKRKSATRAIKQDNRF